MINKDLVIIGGGPGGLTAGIYGKRSELDLIVLDSGIGGGQIANAGLVENYPGFPKGIRGMDLAEAFRAQAENTGVPINIIEPVSEVAKEKNLFIIKTSKESYKSKALIVASGQEYKKINVPGENELSGRGISYCATCDGAFFKGKKVAVLGGGTGAAMAALNLSGLASEIVIVTRRESLKVVEKIMETRLKKTKNITIIPLAKVKTIKGNTHVEGLEIVIDEQNKILPVDGVFVEVGKLPLTSFLQGLDLNLKKGYIVTDKNQMTSIPGLFAAGDVVYKSVKQVGVAVAQGTIAAISAYDYIKNNF